MEVNTMRAIVRNSYGSADVLRLEEVPKPVPKDDEVLVKVHAASVNPADWRVMRADPVLVRLMGMGLLRPKHSILNQSQGEMCIYLTLGIGPRFSQECFSP